ncbi:MAG: NAD-dependent epimerase/dehydratase family protein [Solirubrobacterales bacterium]|nr:NAD-dependent epimerase/dehydratase family protein [Solirubrobacterales bacterium]
MGLTVAVTGPTGEIGKPFIRALERSRDVTRIVGMARRPFDAAAHGWKKTEYRQGDVLDRDSVDALVAGADVVVHLAFIIMAAGEETRAVNLEGSRNVFDAAAAAGVARLVYASSVAAYGFHEDNPALLTEDVPARGTEAHPYSAQKAAVEQVLAQSLAGTGTEAWVFRPCIVAGPEAPLLIDQIPYVRLGGMLPAAVRALLHQVPILKPVLPDPGVQLQLVHHDDVATALRAGVLGRGQPGVYNLAGAGEITMKDVADALGYSSIPLPELAVDAAAHIVSLLPFLPAEASWIEALRTPVLMDTAKARKALRWRPAHDALDTLRETVAGARRDLEGA